MNQDQFITILKEAAENWHVHQTQNNILQAEEFFEEYDKVKDKLWNPEMSDFLKNHSFTKCMIYAHYLQLHYDYGLQNKKQRPNLRIVH